MSRYNTGNAVPSNQMKDLSDNAQIVDEIAHKQSGTTLDRFGNPIKTWFGIQQDANSAISAYGYITIDSFQAGASITLPNQVLRDTSTGEYYRWDGALPKTVSAGSTPASSGGVGAGAWLSVGDATLRGNLASSSAGLGDNIISHGQLTLNEYLSVKDMTEIFSLKLRSNQAVKLELYGDSTFCVFR